MARSQEKRGHQSNSSQHSESRSINSEVRTSVSPLKAIKRPAKMPKLDLNNNQMIDDDIDKVNVRDFIK